VWPFIATPLLSTKLIVDSVSATLEHLFAQNRLKVRSSGARSPVVAVLLLLRFYSTSFVSSVRRSRVQKYFLPFLLCLMKSRREGTMIVLVRSRMKLNYVDGMLASEDAHSKRYYSRM